MLLYIYRLVGWMDRWIDGCDGWVGIGFLSAPMLCGANNEVETCLKGSFWWCKVQGPWLFLNSFIQTKNPLDHIVFVTFDFKRSDLKRRDLSGNNWSAAAISWVSKLVKSNFTLRLAKREQTFKHSKDTLHTSATVKLFQYFHFLLWSVLLQT